MARKLRSAVELASDIGAKAFDLYAHGDRAAVDALRVLVSVNPEMFAWLRDRLNEATTQEPSATALRGDER